MHLFNRVKFSTPESVELEFTLAGIGNRAWALIIDYHILAAMVVMFLIVWTTVSVQLGDLWASIFGAKVGLWLMAIAFFILFGIYTGYFVFFETLWHGQTPGKRFAKIRVVRDDGRPVGLQQATLRSLLRIFDEFLYIGAFLIALTRYEKRLGDFAAGTIVIQAQAPITSSTLKISPQANSLHQQLLEICDLSLLLPDDFAVIREYLQRRSLMSPKAKASLSLKLTQQLQGILHLEKIPDGFDLDVFLEAVYLGYQEREF
ncbi:RDD family protein [Fortiea contorta]|uniref:RDD family protein n=1 Tax=Fortiea contorta TaxID=1892405 RepID=UPI000344C293|nr:RDD family protein [Fortiea contorta]